MTGRWWKSPSCKVGFVEESCILKRSQFGLVAILLHTNEMPKLDLHQQLLLICDAETSTTTTNYHDKDKRRIIKHF